MTPCCQDKSGLAILFLTNYLIGFNNLSKLITPLPSRVAKGGWEEVIAKVPISPLP
jgi:hypothetical protein